MDEKKLICGIAAAVLFLAFNAIAFFLIKSNYQKKSRKMPPVPTALLVVFALLGPFGSLLGTLFYEKPNRGGIASAVFCLMGSVLLIGSGVFFFVTGKHAAGESPARGDETAIASAEALATAENRTEEPESETASPAPTFRADDESSVEPESESAPVTITIRAIGDMLMHPGVSGSAVQEDGTLDYSCMFDAIREEIASADIAVVNNEVPFGGDEYGLRNYPAFNVFTHLGDAEVKAGFDVMLYATNHVRDMGTKGIDYTLDFWKKYPEATILGIHETEEDSRRLTILERNGVKIALFNYVYGINAGFPYDRPYLVDCMRAEDQAKIREELLRAEEEADFTIVFPHWGSEYQLRESSSQRAWAQFFTECGADLIIGTHPHCLEPVRIVKASNGNTSLCYYSLGNYISLQDETISMLGGMADVTLTVADGRVFVSDYSTTYLVTHYGASIDGATVYKLDDYTEELASSHGIRTNNLPGNGSSEDGNLNRIYPFSLQTLLRVRDCVESY